MADVPSDDADIEAMLGGTLARVTTARPVNAAPRSVNELSSELNVMLAEAAPKRLRVVRSPTPPQLVDGGEATMHVDLEPDEYFGISSFSSSRAKVLIERSPAHARVLRDKAPGKPMDFGNVGHRLVLGCGKAYAVLPHASFRTKAAKGDRDRARAAGRVPILADDFETAQDAADAVRAQLADRDIILDGRSEAVVTWVEPTRRGGVPCKAMLDHVWIDRGLILDLKFTGDASPDAIERTAENLNYGIQFAAYRRALVRLRPEMAGRVRFLFAFCEMEPPFALNLVEPDGMFAELGERRWQRALETWAECIATNTWPGYGAGINRISPPAWALRREEHAA